MPCRNSIHSACNLQSLSVESIPLRLWFQPPWGCSSNTAWRSHRLIADHKAQTPRSSLQDHGALPAISPLCRAFLSMYYYWLQSPSSRRLWMLKRSPTSGFSRSILVSLLCLLGLFGTDCISIFACLPMHSQSISCGPQPSSRSAARSWS